MIDAGMNILVINLSMVTRDVCKDVVRCIRELEESNNYERLIAIVIDVTGAPVRTGTFREGLSYEAKLEEGSRVTLTLDENYKFNCTEELIFIDTQFFPKLIHYLRKGDRIYLDEGQVTLVVRDIGFDCISCIVEEGGMIGSFKCLTLPRNRLDQKILYSTYAKDLDFAAECGADFVFTNFAGSSSMIEDARRILPKTVKVFAKIETRESVKNLRELIAVSDGILICRSGLAMYYTPEKIFKIQKYIVGHCNVADKPVFVTGQLAESMASKPRPTRAEASDIANAVLDGVDGLLLTIETSWGMYPFDAVNVVDNVCREAERAVCHETSRNELNYCRLLRGQVNDSIKNVTGASAVEAADSCGASAIFVITTTGASAISIAMSRPSCIVIAITVDIAVARYCLAYRGLHPYLYAGERVTEWCEDVDNRINAAIEHTRHTGLVKGGDRIIVVTGSVGTSGSTNTIHIFTLEGEHSKLRIVGSSHELSQVESPWSMEHIGVAFPFSSAVGASKARQEFAVGQRYSVMLSRDIDQIADNVRQTTIVCTLGKSWKTKEGILKMMDAGMNIMLINLSMTPRDICKAVIHYAREIEKESDYARLLGIAMDMTAAPVRTGIFEGGPSYEATLKEGARVTLTLDDHYKFKCTPEIIFINTKYFPQLIQSLRKGDRVYLDDGQVSLIVKDVELDCINCMVDYVFTSFAENSIMINLARNNLPGTTKVFAKLETREAILNLHDLISASDGLVIRRSDLAMQYTPEKIFKLQKYIVAHCNIAEKPVFIIEQLLESMVSKPRPTRAESSDIANAVLDGADGLVLTMETSWGLYALDSVRVVDNICREAERAVFHFETRGELKQCRMQMEQGSFDIRSVTGASAAEAAASCNATAIFVITTTGASATSIAMLRPPCSVIAITLDVSVARHCLAYRGLHCYVYTGKSEGDWALDIDNRVNAAIEHARNTGLVKGGDRIIVVTGSVATSGSTNTMQIFTLEEEHSKLRIVGSSNEAAAADTHESPLNLTDSSMEQQQKDNDEIDALEEVRLIRGARSRRPRFSVMLSSSKSGFGGINDIRVPL
ncbi:unnamed protein product [Hydatigera taeniaeformis]|uniref:Pyruvate kinase n=1 Tax=Hydatigena taeniaeformis TaxID=6205 RepID=A0A158RE76_HYDTA|nr:unnamed protein product [Hydatigera taeniaeformis]